MATIRVFSNKTLTHPAGLAKCAIGAGGFARQKTEGDNATPLGDWPLRRVLYRADRISRPRTGLKTTPLTRRDAWCDASDDAMYNRKVSLPHPASAEPLWRHDHLYDILVVLGYNDEPPAARRGSAIFLHLAHGNYSATRGCVAVALDDLLRMLPFLGPCDSIKIG
jgi:L,D-peptidoglycan transpeptidase YkuD (ErfK/YbiS/YcfS/YnhG family)